MKVVDAAKVFNWLSDCVFAIAPWNKERNKNADYSAIDVANKQIEVLREVMQYIEESEFDAVPVVRCKDCICRAENKEKGYKYCMFAGWLVKDDDFCSKWEKMDEEVQDGTD